MTLIKSLTQTVNILRSSHITPYKAYVNRQHRFVVCLNPKVGSTAFRKAFVEAMHLLNKPPFRSKLWPMTHTRRYTTSPLADFIDAFGNINDYSFHCFVRNPYSRILSAWNDKFVKGFNSKNYPASVRKLVTQIRQFALVNELQGSDDSTAIPFLTFLSFVESQAEFKRNQHWDTQNAVLCMNKIQYRYIYPIETEFNYGMANILTPLGIKEEWLYEKLATKINASGIVNGFKYTEQSAERVYQLYKVDFDLLGYSKDSWQQL
ncbi:MAG: sulfotransferase family protein [Gammaproteobacteria bacterium]|nr:sulfotransferase family protein [Gammaproteobacteria bacterium]